MTRHLSPLALDALALDALPQDAGARAHLAVCAVCRACADEARALREQLPPRIMARTLGARARSRRWAALRVLAPIVIAAAALVLVVGKKADPPSAAAPQIAPEMTIKGGPSLRVYTMQGDQVFAVSDGVALAPGDEIRFVVTPAGFGFVLIASLDGNRNTTIYVPYDGTQSTAIDPQARTELPGSIVLDDAPGPERVFAVFSATPISAADVRLALEQLVANEPDQVRGSPSLALPVPTRQVSLRFEKVAP